ncbi:MAG: response regulator [Promethearchaeota archaeon]
MIIPNIFIVEDDLNIVKLYINALQVFGHIVVGCAYDGMEAILKFKDFMTKPDLIIMDHRMPIKNGIDTMKEILEIEPNMKIIFASADIQIRDIAMKAGAISFQEKPFSIIQLKEKINKALDPKG